MLSLSSRIPQDRSKVWALAREIGPPAPGQQEGRGKRVNPPVLKWLGWATAAIMAAAAIGMFATMG